MGHKISILKNRQDFLRLAAARIKWVSASMIVQMAANEGNSAISVGYTASKKVGNAIRRNRAKRRLREVVRQILPAQGMNGHDYVLIARSATVEVPFPQLIKDFSWCLKRLHHGQRSEKADET